MGTAEQPGRVYDIFRTTMELNIEFGSADVELIAEDPITTVIIEQVEKNSD